MLNIYGHALSTRTNLCKDKTTQEQNKNRSRHRNVMPTQKWHESTEMPKYVNISEHKKKKKQ